MCSAPSFRRQKKRNDSQGMCGVVEGSLQKGSEGDRMYAALRIIDRSIFHARIFFTIIICRQNTSTLFYCIVRSSSKTLIISSIFHFRATSRLSLGTAAAVAGCFVEFREWSDYCRHSMKCVWSPCKLCEDCGNDFIDVSIEGQLLDP